MLAVLEWLRALDDAVAGADSVAVSASFIWGILSVVLSPCHLSSIPLIVGFISRQGRVTPRGALLVSTMFSAGILVMIAVIGCVTWSLGRVIGSLGSGVSYGVAVIFLVIGLHLLDGIPMPWSGPGQVRMTRRGALAALILGLVFGVALGPCTFAFMIPVLAVVVKVASRRPIYAGLLLGVYGVGHCLVIIAAGTSAGWVQRYLNWNEKSKGAVLLKRVCGCLVILGGLWLIYTA